MKKILLLSIRIPPSEFCILYTKDFNAWVGKKGERKSMTQCTLFLTCCCRRFFFSLFFFSINAKNRLVIRRSQEHGKHGTSAGLFALALIFTIHNKFNLFYLSCTRSLGLCSVSLRAWWWCLLVQCFFFSSPLFVVGFFLLSLCRGYHIRTGRKSEEKTEKISSDRFDCFSKLLATHNTNTTEYPTLCFSRDIQHYLLSRWSVSYIRTRRQKEEEKSTLGQLVVACVLIRCSFGKF